MQVVDSKEVVCGFKVRDVLSSGRSGRLAAKDHGLCPHLSEGLRVEVLSAQFFSAPLFEQQEK